MAWIHFQVKSLAMTQHTTFIRFTYMVFKTDLYFSAQLLGKSTSLNEII